ncbi:hypothetical protein [Streptomyces sp. LNU-CPARS28]|uniref:hypothetical protein n=1 Tax=Streptomyces sp. LNU-CPARS28 TaxID=3137371 RepID=UPI003137015E
MTTESRSTAAPRSDAGDRAARITALVALVLLVPIAIGSLVLTLSSERASGCLTYGVDCARVSPALAAGAFLVSAVSGVLAAAWPHRREPFEGWRGLLITVQISAQVTLAALILSYA